jgi:hypothetical protein
LIKFRDEPPPEPRATANAEGFCRAGDFEKVEKVLADKTSCKQHSCYATTIMEAPYTIASLPKPLDAENGSIYAAPVSSYRGLKKRKRHEVIVGVDGESLNIYNVRLRESLAIGKILINSRSSHSLS